MKPLAALAILAASTLTATTASADWYEICWNEDRGVYDQVCANAQSRAQHERLQRENRSYGYSGHSTSGYSSGYTNGNYGSYVSPYQMPVIITRGLW